MPLTIGGDRCLAILSRQSLVAVKAAGGQEVWSYPWKTEYDVNAADPIVDGDKMFISSGYNHGGALLKLTGQGAGEGLGEQEHAQPLQHLRAVAGASLRPR